PLDGVEVRITKGEIHLRGPMLLRTYRGGACPKDPDGWLPTGDAGWLDDGGRLHVDGRLASLIITGGENVWPEPVEALLGTHPGVAEAAVAGRPDPEWGQRVVAYVVPAAGRAAPTLDELRGIVRDRLAAFAAPKELVLVDQLPRTAIGKVRRDLLA
ncbi:MAG: long-chain fatty acid--CoA ligase, partial [Acidimicrobiaceae bacterium]|nr:long-chain fatty acid--CoA ligase [Acidimicrobiaceae bacterium]